jgi:hypothetical protein
MMKEGRGRRKYNSLQFVRLRLSGWLMRLVLFPGFCRSTRKKQKKQKQLS